MLRFLREKTKVIMITVAIIFAATMFYGLGTGKLSQPTQERKDIIGKVNGKEISTLMFRQILSRMLSQVQGTPDPQVLSYMQNLALNKTIEFSLVSEDAKKHVRVEGSEIDGAIEKIMKDNKVPSKNDFIMLLKRMGYTYPSFRDMLSQDLLVQKRMAQVRGEVSVTPDDLKEIRTRHILIIPKNKDASAETEAKKLAEALLLRIKKGESFEKLAQQYSGDTISAKMGGDLGFFVKGAMVPEFDKAAFALRPGESSGVIKSPFGYHIIKLEEIRLRKSAVAGKDIKDVILEEKQNRAMQEWFSTLYKNSKIEILDKGLKAYDLRTKGNIPEAISTYTQAIRENPSNPYLHIFLGDIYRSQGNIPLTIYEYKNAAAVNPSDPEVRILLGDLYVFVSKQKDVKMDKKDYKSLAAAEFKAAGALAGDNTTLRQELIAKFKELGMNSEVKLQQDNILKIEKRKKFEEGLKKK